MADPATVLSDLLHYARPAVAPGSSNYYLRNLAAGEPVYYVNATQVRLRFLPHRSPAPCAATKRLRNDVPTFFHPNSPAPP